jgi:phosphoglycerol transferase MdoB-like AlkP superfamily enzyme
MLGFVHLQAHFNYTKITALKMNKLRHQISSPIPYFIYFILGFYITGLFVFGLLRFALLLYTADESIQLLSAVTLKSLLIGIQFDTVILAYVFALPLLLLFIQSLFSVQKKYITRAITVLLSIVFPLLVFISIADIPYFKFFKNRFSDASLQWMGSIEVVLKMIVGNSTNFILLIVALLATFFTGFFIYKYCKRKLINYNWNSDYATYSKTTYFLSFLLIGCCCFLGMRGTITHPIRQGDAFYCNVPFLNQIGLNPAFTLMKSYTSRVRLMDNEQAIKNTQKLLKINTPISIISPIARQEVAGNVNMNKHNVVLVIMESMSANYMGVFGNTNHLTPTLDSLSKKSCFFKNAYSAGIHTNNGVFSSLFSFPALKRIRPMSTVPVNTYSGLPYTLKQNGYKNLFFSTHNESFDNIGNFIPNNFFDELYTAEDYPHDKIIGPFGVPDDYLFSFAADKLNKQGAAKPFFATILTTSNHDPYVLPIYFKSSIKQKDLKAVAYADWSINKFLNEVKTSTWFANTIFVFVADHGLTVGYNPYDLVLSYNHIPIIVYAPELLGAPKVQDTFMGQIDLFPTIMGLLNVSYINNTLGVNVLTQQRDCMYFSADDKIGCINNEWLYIYRFGGNEGLYHYKTGNTTDFSHTQKEVFEKLKKQALSQIQTAEWIITNNKTSLLQKN